ncbi:MAG: lycopene beta-cyclase CrtY [Alphaproteobacteria bacterium]
MILVGGGLANGLIALRLRATRPELRLLIVEAGSRLGADHTWSFHATDLTPDQRRWIESLLAHCWPGYTVAFPDLRRRLALAYCTITAERFHEVVSDALTGRIRFGARAVELGPNRVRLHTGECLTAAAVIDGRGPQPTLSLDLAFQKFVGCEISLARPHGLPEPVLMDATVPQSDGYRFVYLLPFDPRTLLIEDTYYSDSANLDTGTLRRRIVAYAASREWQVRDVIREERGVLPIVLGGDLDAFWAEAPAGIPRSGLRAGLFHPTTGYSLPEAVRLADRIAAMPDLSSAALDSEIRRYARERWRAQGLFRMLNRMMFRAGAPERRYRVMQRFYRLPEDVIARFYAGEPSWSDSVRLLAGRPPVPVGAALVAALSIDRRARA